MKRLFIIGNGFDLAHKLPTSYADYREWLKQYYPQFLEVLEEIYCYSSYVDEETLWSEFEQALGMFDIEEIFNNLSAELDFDEDHMFRTSANIEDYFEELGNIITDNFQISLKEWLISVDNLHISPLERYTFTEGDNFLSFNYTNTLERLYGINSAHILHIHGYLNNDHELTIGYKDDGLSKFDIDPDGYVFEENAKNSIYTALYQLRKDPKRILNQHKEKILSFLDNISEVNVIGFSYSKIDFEYFEFIRRCIACRIKWNFYYHNNEDLVLAQRYSKNLSINPNYLRC